jgi:hypothetical protein
VGGGQDWAGVAGWKIEVGGSEYETILIALGREMVELTLLSLEWDVSHKIGAVSSLVTSG